MEIKEIQSAQHPLVKHLVKLRTNRQQRILSGTALISGKKLILELGTTKKLKTILKEKKFLLDPKIKAEKIYIVSNEILKKVTGLESPEPLAAEIALPPSADLTGKKWVLALNSINDPGNLGTLLRTALALGWDGVFITSDSVDPFNDKALRAAKGATFSLPFCLGTEEELHQLILKNKWHVYAADMAGAPLEQISVKMPLLLLLGNESHGIAESFKRQYSTVSIPMDPKMESLNVSIAGAILLYHLKNS